MSQITAEDTCRQKTTYATKEAAKRAIKRRNRATGYKYLRQYKCNVCNLWHATTQIKENIADEQVQ